MILLDAFKGVLTALSVKPIRKTNKVFERNTGQVWSSQSVLGEIL